MKNFWKIKTILRIVGIISMVLVIGFSMAACGGGEEEEGEEEETTTTTTGGGGLQLTIVDSGMSGFYLAVRDASYNFPDINFDTSMITKETAASWFTFTSVDGLDWTVAKRVASSEKLERPEFTVTSLTGDNTKVTVNTSALSAITATIKDLPAGKTLTLSYAASDGITIKTRKSQ